jgi:hypothetical protein
MLLATVKTAAVGGCITQQLEVGAGTPAAAATAGSRCCILRRRAADCPNAGLLAAG